MNLESLNKKLDELAEVQSREFKLVMGALARERDVSREIAQGMAKFGSGLEEVKQTVEELIKTTASLHGRLEERANNYDQMEAGMSRYFQAFNDQAETVRAALPEDGFDLREEIGKINERLDRLENRPPAA